jgi:polyisoprenoid-binding protein YceI
MTRPIETVAVLFVMTVAAWSVNTLAAGRTYAIDAERSRAVIAVGKAGALSFAAGHTHEVLASVITGIVNVDTTRLAQSSVRLTIDTTALRVTGKGEPLEDVPEVQRVMLSDKVLDVQRNPTIAFESTGLTVDRQTPTAADLALAGQLNLHGVTRSLTVPVHVEFTTPDTLTRRGHLRVKQTDFGIAPVSVAGVVKVKDALDVEFTIVAEARNGS